MLHTDFMSEVVGHIDRPIRKMELRDGIGASFSVKVTREWVDQYNIPHAKTFWVPCLTFDTAWAGYILEHFDQGSFVKVIIRELSIGKPRQGRSRDGKPGEWFNSFDFIIDFIEDAREVNEVAAAEAREVLSGVTTSS